MREGHVDADPGASEMVRSGGIVAGSDGEPGCRLVGHAERRSGRAVVESARPPACGPSHRPGRRSGPRATASGRHAAGRSTVIERSRFGALTIDLGPLDPSAAGRFLEVHRGRDRTATGHDGQDPRSGGPVSSRYSTTVRGANAPRRQLTTVSAIMATPTSSAASAFERRDPDPQPERHDTEQEDPTDGDRDDGPAERTDHPTRQAVAPSPRGDEEEHREDAAQQRQGQRPDEVERLGERDGAPRQQHLDDQEDDRERRGADGEVDEASAVAFEGLPSAPDRAAIRSAIWLKMPSPR